MRAAIIPTRDRPQDFADCVAAINPQVDLIIVVAHGYAAYDYALGVGAADVVLLYSGPVPNISEMWRIGMDEARLRGASWVAVLNDDAIVGPHWFDTLLAYADHMHAAGASAYRSARSRKIAGYAFILDLASGVRPDERLRWWYSDDAIQRRCEEHSWFALVPHTPLVRVEHRHPDGGITANPVLRDISNQDRLIFEQHYNDRSSK